MKIPKKPTAINVLTWMGILACGSVTTVAGLFIFVLVIKSIQEVTLFKDGYQAPWWDEEQHSNTCTSPESAACKATQICQSWQENWNPPPAYCERCTEPEQCLISDQEFQNTRLGVVDN